MSGEGRRFFERLAGQEHTGQVLAAFEQFLNRPLDLSASDLFSALYRNLIDHVLAWLELRAQPGAALREWRPLYQLAGEIDPYYVTAGQIEQQLDKCVPMHAGQRESLTGILLEYFRLRREGFLETFPSPLVGEEDCTRWSKIFPPEFTWRSLDILHAVGLYPIGSYVGYRAWMRFEEGEFQPPASQERFRRWRACCGEGGQEKSDPAHAHRRDFLVAVFGGGFPSLHLPSYCGDRPRCGDCPLHGECRWAKDAAKSSRSTAEIIGRLGQGRLAHLSTAQLMQAVFGLNEAGGEVLSAALDKTTLRRLAVMSHQELEEWLDGTGLPVERLRGLIDLSRRFSEEPLSPGMPLQSGREVFHHFRFRLRDLKQEQFLVVLLDAQRRFLGDVLVSQGTLTNSPVHPREVFNMAVREHAASVLIVHNHPSGNPAPSKDDVQITRRLIDAGKMIGIPVLDHIIIAGDNYLSFVEQNLM
ncbi:MAG: hypothetical protein O7C61_03505 [SAR324 cluster bacterium]|nr:hypothetical protein [SAR324 cluster bacterium]